MHNCVFAYLQYARLTKTGEIRKYAKDTIRKELFLPVLLRICEFVSEPKKSQPEHYFRHIMNVTPRVCRYPDSWSWTDQSQISLMHSPTPPKCSTRAIVALINNLGIVYHQYCSSSGVTCHHQRHTQASHAYGTRNIESKILSLLSVPI